MTDPAPPTLYQRLGLTPAASTTEVRDAYRALAQRLHPDRLSGASAGERALAERRMREINEAWTVLQDPARRRAYDLERLDRARVRPAARGGGPRTEPAPPARRAGSSPVVVDDDDDLVDVSPHLTGATATLARHLPWVVIVVVFAVIFVLSAYAGGGSSDPAPTVGPVLVEGACIDVASGPVATVVACDGPHEFRIEARVADATACPSGTEPRYLDPDGTVDCLSTG